jgi:dinuclear metal center YbgI/SA1388 family protein
MTIQRTELLAYLNQLLQPEKLKDYCPNGLQVEGNPHIKRIVTGVTASQALIEQAIERNADALLVHHGYFWKGESPVVTGMKQRRLKALLTHNINLIAYHLPLDVHPELGNNAQLARVLGMRVTADLTPGNPAVVGLQGDLVEPLSGEQFKQRIIERLNYQPVYQPAPQLVKRIAWCTGGGQGFIEQAAEAGVDAYISGEASEQTIHVAREMGLHFYAAGHHATERYGVKTLGEHLSEHFGLSVEFVDIDNPV